MKMLLVDDDAFLRDMYAKKFDENGHEVETAETAIDGLRKLQADASYEVLLLDLVMPGMTGLELMQKIQDQLSDRQLKIVVLSNQGEKSDIQAAMDAGAIGYIVKAESIPSEVVTRVTELCSS